jgi:hypothetical protein
LTDSGRFDEACAVAETRMQLLPLVADPDHVAEALMNDVDLFLTVGRLAEARETASRLEETVVGLTSHHRVHGLATRLLFDAAIGDWVEIRALVPRAEDAVEANLTTPCPLNVGMLLVAALSLAYGDDWLEVSRLTAKAESIGMVGYGRAHAPKWLRLAIVRRDREEMRRVVDSIDPSWLTPGAYERWAAFLDGLAALGDRERIETEAPQWVRPNAYVAPFAVRALGVVRHDKGLLAEAVGRFEAMGLEWHARETELMARGAEHADSAQSEISSPP